MKIPNVPNTSVKLMLFPFSLEGAARIWLEKEPPRSIETWDDLVSKFINKFFPPSKTTNLRNEITRFQQKFDETFYEAWDRFNDLLRGSKTVETSVNEPPEVELKELPPHLEYAFLEGDNKLPVIIAKDLKDEEKTALLKVLKSHKRAITWKLSDIKGVSPEFCTHKILMEEDYEPSVQSQRRIPIDPKDQEKTTSQSQRNHLPIAACLWVSNAPWKNYANRMRCHKTPSKFAKIFDIWGIEFYGAVPNLQEGTKSQTRAVDYLSKLEDFLGKIEIPLVPGPFTVVQGFPYGTVELSQKLRRDQL
ncbi:reverse transcriptase domain-containing protein [Tanacetum coccineum]|uniref:Reverse transcriptase domain-containing protein n=1 Tax=Tanacetum coccineum TaxID=301880 RepID=A0ABQ5A0S8_9ASTR